MAELVENGPSNYNGEAEQVWERPWTLDEMQKSSADWSLAADSGLFLYLQNFSQWMLSKTHEIEKQLDGLIRDTKATDSCLHTVFNDFLMLSNIQFIENRVYDEEVEDPIAKAEVEEKRPEQEKTREQKEAELIPKVQEAVNYGLKVLESAFEQLDIKVGNSDSEDEEAADRVEPILEPKDLYVDRPLPCLIGSQAFMEQDDVGLGDLSSDEMSIDSERDIESEEGKDEDEVQLDVVQSDEDFDQEEVGQGSIKKKPSVVSYDEEDEENEDSDLFAESDKDDDDARSDDVGPTSFADELAARIKGEATNKPEADRASLASAMSVNKKKNKGKKLPESQVQEDDDDDDDMFKPPDMEADEFSPFGGKGGLFSGGKGLFDDDDEGDLFSEASKIDVEKEQTTSQTESAKTRKIPTGAVSIFPGSGLLGSQNGSESLENKETSSAKPKVQATPERESSGGGLFDDSDDGDDDFFSGKTLKKPTGTQEKPKPKTSKGLFGGDEEEDDEDGDIFTTGSRSAFSQPSKKSVDEEEAVRPPEKKVLAGAVSMFGPGTQNLLGESLKKHQSTASEDSVKSEERAPPPVVPKPSTAPKPSEKAQNKSLFSDEEDSQIFPAMSKSQSKPEVQKIKSKATLSIFDDDEEEDLFSSVLKSESVQGKTATPKLKKTVSSSLFSDDEDQWMNDKPSTVKPEVKSGGMKASTSAPSKLHSAKKSQKSSLFDEQDDDLFAATKETRQTKPQRVSLLFEDENDEDKGSLFGFKPPAKIGTHDVKVPAAASQAPSLFGPDANKEAASLPVEKVAEEKPLEEKTLQATSTPEESNKNKKPPGVVDLFEGIDVLGDDSKPTTNKNDNYLENEDDFEWHKEAPPPMDSKEKKTKKNTFSLFDDDEDDDEQEGADEISPFSTATKPSDKNTLKAQEQKASVRSTGVFQDEELLFSQTQQRDNDPEVDLFATSAKPSAPLPSSVKPAAPTLFGDDDDDDDLFSTTKPKVPPKVPVKPKNDESGKVSNAARSAESEATLAINPTSLMPGAGLRIPGAVSVMPGLTHSPSPRAAGLTESVLAAEGGVSFETPAQVTTLQNANKDRARGATRRRPQTRAARQLAAQRSEEAHGDNHEEPAQAASGARTTSSLPPFNHGPVRPSALTLPVMTSTITAPTQPASDEVVRSKIIPAPEDDLFSSQDLFATPPAPTPSPQPKTKPSEPVSNGASKKKDPALAIFDDHSDDLFTAVKPKPVKKAKAMPLLNDDEAEDGDIFGTEKKKESKTSATSSKIDIFQDEKQTPSQVLKKPKDQSLDASLFDDNVDIFADLTPSTKPKEKKAKKKVETKSIFDDDMDDIFSSGLAKPVLASSSKKSKKPVQEISSAEESGHSIFDDPLNVLGGN